MYLFQVDQHLHPTAPRDAVHQALEQQLIFMAAAYRNPAIAPFHAEPLIDAYNACVQRHMQFAIGQSGCAMEFLAMFGELGHGGMLGHLSMAPNYLVTYMQQGHCYSCDRHYQQVINTIYTIN